MSAFFPVAASTIAPEVDAITLALLAASALVLSLVFGLILFFGIRYRKGSPHSRIIHPKSPSMLELGWSSAALLIFLGLCAWGSVVFVKMHNVPPGAEEVTVVAKQWMWKFQHAEGQRELNELHVPVGRPILLTMTSQDVIHSLFVPAFRLKQDVLPGRYTQTWFEATIPGEYRLFCAQYCGTAHADMRAKVIVLSMADYQQWLQTGISAHLVKGAERGKQLFNRLGCASCHDPDANVGIKAPNLEDLYGSDVPLSDGTTVKADENYLRESIYNPNAKIVQGYPAIMPTYSSLASEEDVLDLIAYIKERHKGLRGEKSNE